jgi:hypothetical protein
MDGAAARALVVQADGEMTRQGWNPKGTFTDTLRQAIAVAAAQRRDIAAPVSRPVEPIPASPCVGLVGPAAYR